MSISRKVVDHPILTLIAFALLGILSIYSLSGISLGLFPNIDNPVLMVSTSYASAGPESVEKSVTSVLETGLVGVPKLKKMSSTSSEASSFIKLEFKYGTNLDEATNDVRDKIDMVKGSLPDGAGTPRILKFDTSSMPIVKIAVRGSRTAEELRRISEDTIVDRLQQADGVAQASTSGGRDKIIRVEISQNRLEAYGLTMTGVASALSAQNLELGGGKIVEGTKNYTVRTVGEFANVDEINNAIVATKNGYVVRLSDIGTTVVGYEDASSYVYVDGKPGVYVSVTKQSDANTVSVANAVYEKMNEIKKLIPSDVSLEIISDTSTQVRDTLNELLKAAWEGAILAMLVLFLFLRNIKSTAIMGISIPYSILITLLCMHFAGITLNMMTMTGLILGVGMVVDASVVILENIYQYRERGTKPVVAATIGSQEMFSVVIAGSLTHICVFFPIIFFKNDLGIIGQILPDLIFTMMIALVSSLFVALFLVPVLSSKFLIIETRKERPLKNPLLVAGDRVVGGFIDRMTAAYTNGLRFVLRHRKAAAIVVVGSLAVSFALFTRLNITLMPGMSDESITLQATLPVGTKLEETNAVLTQMEAIVREEVKGYKTLITSVGTGSGFSSNDKTYYGTLQIQLPSSSKQVDSVETIKTKLRKHFDDFPSASFDFGQGQMQQMTGSDIDIALSADDLSTGLKTAKQIVKILKEKVPDISEASLDTTEGLPQVEVSIDRERAYSFGVTVTSVAKELNACVEGITATVYREAGKEYNVDLMLKEADRSKVPDLEKIYVSGSSGLVALSNFATIKKGIGPVSINREDQRRIIHITANILSNTRANEVEKKIQQAIDDSIILPDGVSLSYEGSWKDIMKTALVFLMIITMALLLVYGIMAGTYESFKDPFINLFTIPLGIIGVVGIYIITGQNFSMFTAFGFVMLIGIAVNNGIIMVDQMNLLVSRGIPMKEACVTAATSRLRPVLMTTLTALLGMVPLAFFPSGNSMMLQPIGLCVFGGLTSSTLMTLFFIPVLYTVINERAERRAEKTKAKKALRRQSPREANNVQG